MSSFKHHRSNKNRYNIYETHVETVETNSFYVILRNTLFLIALILSLFVTSFILLDTYQNKNLQLLTINQVQQDPLKDENTKIKLTKAISNSILQKIDTDNSIKSINHHQLKHIIKNVMEKVKNSPKQIIYTKK